MSDYYDDRVRRVRDRLAFAVRYRDEMAESIRERLHAGFDPTGCMHEVTVTHASGDERRRQCQKHARPCKAFFGIFSFCTDHAPLVSGICSDVDEARSELRLLETERRSHDEQSARRLRGEWGVYVVHDPAAGRAKVGMTGNRPKRVGALRSGAAGQLRELAWIPAENARGLERYLHRHFSAARITPRGEWFTVDDPDAFAAQALEAAESYLEQDVEE